MTHNGLFLEALDHYSKMRFLSIKPDSVINACVCLGQSETAKIVHQHVLELGFDSDLYIGNALIDMYARLSALDIARQVFDEMPKRDVISWNSLVIVPMRNGRKLYKCFTNLEQLPDSFMMTSVLPACSGLGVIMARYYYLEHYNHWMLSSMPIARVCQVRMPKKGYVANLRSVLRDVEEDEKWEILCGHSERLAIAFG
ncbi:LOW QUALITY PROTEIN: hypothetical protein OSB04_013047 [Centaurea solstitialis]|uniref:DYW domain-containing protein n=1 Tax=Centaurea solstitialis TaxID=347529 RepID=A0AA38TCI3_9ASTR|nr:LOW QUALITY PROTEIN: hypothetical protein OSB04_013047 [Centaurea solstitialis]